VCVALKLLVVALSAHEPGVNVLFDTLRAGKLLSTNAKFYADRDSAFTRTPPLFHHHLPRLVFFGGWERQTMNHDPARREFLRLVGVAVPASMVLCACGGHGAGGSARAGQSSAYFDSGEMDFIRAATARLIPTDALGPGADQAGVPTFIDLQLAGPYGRAERWYMQGPWPSGTDSQGYQLRYTPAQIYRQAIAGIDGHCRAQYRQPFARLQSAQQDEVLHALEEGKVDLGDLPSKSFFDLLWQNTQEGFLADPAYGGNRDFAGWKLIGFPGPRYNYVREISEYGQPYRQPYVSLIGRVPGTALAHAAEAS
jgi:gluconate 2-dehydrogenase gamma chain